MAYRYDRSRFRSEDAYRLYRYAQARGTDPDELTQQQRREARGKAGPSAFADVLRSGKVADFQVYGTAEPRYAGDRAVVRATVVLTSGELRTYTVAEPARGRSTFTPAQLRDLDDLERALRRMEKGGDVQMTWNVSP